VLYQERNDFVHEGRITAEVAEMVDLLSACAASRLVCSQERFTIPVDISEYRESHLFVSLLITTVHTPFCLVHNPADIAEASSLKRMSVAAVAAASLLLIRDFFKNGRGAIVFQHIPDEILFIISKTVTDLIFCHVAPSPKTIYYKPCFFKTGAISSNE
jgi:hypothetical protein